jgi:tRNA(Arg) A34 adenosine deaminase TadA
MLHAEVLLLLSERKLNNDKNNKSDDDENMALRITPHPSPSKKQTLLVSLQCCRMCAALASASQKALNLSEVIYLKKDLGPLALNTALQIQTTSTDENVVLRERQFSSLRCKRF